MEGFICFGSCENHINRNPFIGTIAGTVSPDRITITHFYQQPTEVIPSRIAVPEAETISFVRFQFLREIKITGFTLSIHIDGRKTQTGSSGVCIRFVTAVKIIGFIFILNTHIAVPQRIDSNRYIVVVATGTCQSPIVRRTVVVDRIDFETTILNKIYVSFVESWCQFESGRSYIWQYCHRWFFAEGKVIERRSNCFFAIIARPCRKLKANGFCISRRGKCLVMHLPVTIVYTCKHRASCFITTIFVYSFKTEAAFVKIVECSHIAPCPWLTGGTATGNGNVVLCIGFYSYFACMCIFIIYIVGNHAVTIHFKTGISIAFQFRIRYPCHDSICHEIRIFGIFETTVFDDIIELESRKRESSEKRSVTINCGNAKGRESKTENMETVVVGQTTGNSGSGCERIRLFCQGTT